MQHSCLPALDGRNDAGVVGGPEAGGEALGEVGAQEQVAGHHRRHDARRSAGGRGYAEAFTVQPFGNTLVVKTCTGQQIYDVLNQQFGNPSAGSNRIMLPSANVHYQWSSTPTPHIVDGSVKFDGTPIDKAAPYRVVVNNFMADGGDNYTVFKACTDPLGGAVDLDAFAAYLAAHPGLAPPALTRIEKVP
jgi:5'-nucleotidase